MWKRRQIEGCGKKGRKRDVERKKDEEKKENKERRIRGDESTSQKKSIGVEEEGRGRGEGKEEERSGWGREVKGREEKGKEGKRRK